VILLSLDFETTGLDFEKDRIIEIGAILYSTTQKKCLDSVGRLVQTDVPITSEITEITNIHPAAVTRFGYEQDSAFEVLEYMATACDAIAGHNIKRFDMRMANKWASMMQRVLPQRTIIDTMIDIKGHEGKKLTYLAADHGVLNLFPHSALADAQTVLSIIEKYDINDIVNRAKTPTVYIQARQSRDQNELAKKAKFRWNPMHKIWWKPVKETDVDDLSRSCPFPISYVEKEIVHDLELS
jgi:DNA polymerase-3 subunit epsilon